MTPGPGLSLRRAVDWIRHHHPDDWCAPDTAFDRTAIAADYAARFAGVPATSIARDEKLIRYPVTDSPIPVLLGLYGSADRVRALLPGLPARADQESVGALLAAATPPARVRRPSCQQVRFAEVDLHQLPTLVTTPRDAGPYLTMGVVCATDPMSSEVAMSVHRMLVLSRTELAIWMLPGRALRELHADALGRDAPLAVSVNIGAPPAVLVASALTSGVLPFGVAKLPVAGALAGGPVAVAAALSQPTVVLAESEIVLEGFLTDIVTDETLAGAPDNSLPEFLGYDGSAQRHLPVLTVTAMTTRTDPVYQAVIGPGREQSVILGLAGELSVAIGIDHPDIADLHFSPAGGGMLLLVVALRRRADDDLPAQLAKRILDEHHFVKLIVFTDEDVDVHCAEDVLWAVTTRCAPGTGITALAGFPALAMDPSQRPEWGRNGAGERCHVDATVPKALRDRVFRSFSVDTP